MIRLFILLSLVSCIEVRMPDVIKKPAVKLQAPIFYRKPIALVKFNDVIYHCQSITKTQCGYSIHCDELNYHCANDLVIEYINRE